MIPAVPTLLVLLPLLAAVVLAALRWQVAVWGNLGASGLVFALSLLLPWQGSAAGSWLLADPLATHLVPLVALVGLAAAWFARFHVAAEIAAGRLGGRRLRAFPALFQALLGCELLALLSDDAALSWLAIQAAIFLLVLATALPATPAALRAAWRTLLLAGTGTALALFGTVILYLAARPALGAGPNALAWSALQAAASRCNGPVLSLAFVFLLIGYASSAGLAPLHAWLPDCQAQGSVPITAMLAGGVPVAALVTILRLRGLLDGNGGAIAPGWPIMLLGLASVLLGALSLAGQTDRLRRLAFAGIAQTGVVAIAFGLGGAAATFAGLLHLTTSSLARTALVQARGLAAPAVAAMAVSTMLVGIQAVRLQPVLAVPLLAALVAGAWACLERASAPERPNARSAGAWVLLAAALAAPAASWLRGVAALLP